MKIVLAFQSQVILTEFPSGGAELKTPLFALTYKRPSKGMQQVIRSLSGGGESLDGLIQSVSLIEGASSVPKLYYWLDHWRSKRLIVNKLYTEQGLFAEAVSESAAYTAPESPMDRNQPFILSRFAYIHREQHRMVIKSARVPDSIYLVHPQAVMVCHLLHRPQTAKSAAAELEGISEQELLAFFQALRSAYLLEEATSDESSFESEDPVMRQWEFHDLLFHQGSRSEGDRPYGGTFRFHGTIPPAPARKYVQGERTALYRPNIEQLMQNDVPFTKVMEERSSIRAYAKAPITVDQLGEFLYRTSRVKQVMGMLPGDSRSYEMVSKCYPSGGAMHELELYMTIRRCSGLTSGLYYYDAFEHELVSVAGEGALVEQLMKEAANTAGIHPEELQVSFHIAARFQRVAWKYERIAYSLILKHVGVLYQTMYMTATAMGLAPCAIGGGSADLLSRAAGLNALEEAGVGEFLLGSKGADGHA